MHISIDSIDTDRGRYLVASSEDILYWIGLPGNSNKSAESWIQAHIPDADITYAPTDVSAKVKKWIASLLDGKNNELSFHYSLIGTPFQKKVWQRIAEIPYGETISYKKLAEEIDAPKAVRAVGTACGANPIPLVVACHRVLASNGTLGGYGGGLPLKRMLLTLETRTR